MNRRASYTTRPSITPELVQRFRAYMREDPTLFHSVLDDGNDADRDAQYTAEEALTHGSVEAMVLADVLVRLSRTQRRKLSDLIYKADSAR